MFRLATAYFYKTVNSTDLDLARLYFKSKGGRCIQELEPDAECRSYKLSHIIVDNCTFSMDIFLQAHSKINDNWNQIRFISYKWIKDCQKEKRKLSEKIYIVDN